MPTEQPTFSPEELATEIWKDVVGFVGHYLVSNLARVKSLKPHNMGRILRFYMEKPNWYHTVSLCLDGVSKAYRIHQLVAAAFLGPCPEGHEVDHIDLNKSNSRLSNLRYKTHAENVQLAVEAGVFVRGDDHWTRRESGRVLKGTAHHWHLRRKTTKEQRELIRAEYATGNTSYERLAEKHGLTKSSVEYIVKQPTA